MQNLSFDGVRVAALCLYPVKGCEGGLQPCSFQIWNEPAAKLDRFDGHDAGDAAGAWLSAVVGAPLRLVRMGDEAVGRGPVNRLHIVSRASCDEARAEVQGAGGAAAELLRYRPNIVLAEPGAARACAKARRSRSPSASEPPADRR